LVAPSNSNFRPLRSIAIDSAPMISSQGIGKSSNSRRIRRSKRPILRSQSPYRSVQFRLHIASHPSPIPMRRSATPWAASSTDADRNAERSIGSRSPTKTASAPVRFASAAMTPAYTGDNRA
jgi:hypothetical protein